MKNLITIKNLTKQFEENTILNNISFKIEKCKIIGLLGINGAGKTTLLKLLSGLLQVTEGEILIFNKDPWFDRNILLKDIGLIIETPIFYEHLTAYENIEIHLKYMEVEANINEILKTVDLNPNDKKPLSKFSLGMKQRLAIARAISHNPKLLLLDEPINRLDPIAIRDIRNLFLKLKEKGTTIILSSHILLEDLGSIKNLNEKYKDNLEDYLIERMRG